MAVDEMVNRILPKPEPRLFQVFFDPVVKRRIGNLCSLHFPLVLCISVFTLISSELKLVTSVKLIYVIPS